MSVVRWTLYDPVADETTTLPINPNTATSPFGSKSIASAQGLESDALGRKRMRLTQSASSPVEWQFGGVIRSEAHHDELLRWTEKSNEVRVSDHLGHTFEVIIRKIEFADRRPMPTNQWRLTYTASALVLRRVA